MANVTDMDDAMTSDSAREAVSFYDVITTPPTSGPGTPEVYWEAVLASQLDLYAVGIIMFVGAVANVLAMCVLRRKRLQQHSASLYFLVLAVADFIGLVVAAAGRHWVRALTGIDPPALHTAYCKIWYLVVNCASGYSNWILAGVSVERAIAILAPLKAKRLLQRKVSVIYLIVAFLLNVGYLSHSLVSYLTVTVTSMGRVYSVCTADVTIYFAVVIRPWTDLVFKGLLPATMIISSNVIIVWQIVLAKIRRRALRSSNSASSDADGYNTSSVISMVVTISVAFVVFSLPYHVTYILTTAFPADYVVAGKEAAILRLAWSFSICLLLVNHSGNLFLYLISGREFRLEMKAMFLSLCGRVRQNSGTSHWSTNSRGGTEISGDFSNGNASARSKATESRETLNAYI